jgi:hypothetical protein
MSDPRADVTGRTARAASASRARARRGEERERPRRVSTDEEEAAVKCFLVRGLFFSRERGRAWWESETDERVRLNER